LGLFQPDTGPAKEFCLLAQRNDTVIDQFGNRFDQCAGLAAMVRVGRLVPGGLVCCRVCCVWSPFSFFLVVVFFFYK